MANTIVQLPLDLTGTNPNNHVGSEEHLLVSISGFAYKIITMEHGGFYSKSLRVFDKNFQQLKANTDFIWTYRHDQLSQRTGRDIASAIVFINPALTGKVYVQAQMVGGDLAYSFTVIDDYVAFQKANPHTPYIDDYKGTEPIWGPGELANARWKLDKFMPFNNELENIVSAITSGSVTAEQGYRDHVKDRYDKFMAKFNTDLQAHINDKNDPHNVTPLQVGLDIVQNYKVATDAEAKAGTSNTLYLTPYLANLVVKVNGTDSMEAHIAMRPANPHNTTAAQIQPPVDTKTAQTTKLNAFYLKGDTVANAQTTMYGSTLYNQDSFMQFLRANQNTANFNQGVLVPNQITYGPFGADKILRGDGTWASLTQLAAEYVEQSSSKITYDHNEYLSTAAAIGQFNISLGNLAVYPVGTTRFFFVKTAIYQGYGNGIALNYFRLHYAATRTAAGWQVI